MRQQGFTVAGRGMNLCFPSSGRNCRGDVSSLGRERRLGGDRGGRRCERACVCRRARGRREMGCFEGEGNHGIKREDKGEEKRISKWRMRRKERCGTGGKVSLLVFVREIRLGIT